MKVKAIFAALLVSWACTASAALITGNSMEYIGSTTNNLTSLGSVDWAMWDDDSATPTEQKLNGTAISNLTVVAGGTASLETTGKSETYFSWTDGTPTASNTDYKISPLVLKKIRRKFSSYGI